jgi:hypothetical protein
MKCPTSINFTTLAYKVGTGNGAWNIHYIIIIIVVVIIPYPWYRTSRSSRITCKMKCLQKSSGVFSSVCSSRIVVNCGCVGMWQRNRHGCCFHTMKKILPYPTAVTDDDDDDDADDSGN